MSCVYRHAKVYRGARYPCLVYERLCMSGTHVLCIGVCIRVYRRVHAAIDADTHGCGVYDSGVYRGAKVIAYPQDKGDGVAMSCVSRRKGHVCKVVQFVWFADMDWLLVADMDWLVETRDGMRHD